MQNSDDGREISQSKEHHGAASQRAFRFVLAGLLTSVSVWIALLVLAPYLRSIQSPWGSLVYAVFAPTCHQIDSRCLHIFGHPMAVCARCLGIYLGFFVGSCLFPWLTTWPLRLPRPRTFVFITLPIAMDTMGNMFRVWSTPSPVRLVLGISWGLILPFYLVPGLMDIWQRPPRIFPLK